MIQHFSIQNFGFFRESKLDFSTGFTAITGETGAGKTTFLEAMKAVLGQKITKSLCAESGSTVLELTIKMTPTLQESLLKIMPESEAQNGAPELFIRLIIKNQGRPRYFINEEPVKQADVKSFTDSWFVLHAQHEISSLKKKSATREWLDIYGGLETELSNYQTTWKEYQQLKKQLAILLTDDRDNDREYWQFLAQELEEENLEPGYVSSLEEKVQRLENQENIAREVSVLSEALDGDQGLMTQTEVLKTSLDQLRKYGLDLRHLPFDPEVFTEQLQDLQVFVSHLNAENIYAEQSPQSLQESYQRLLRLQEKHNVHSFTDLAEVELTIQQKIGDIEQREKRLTTIQSTITKTEENLWTHAKKIHAERKNSAKNLATAIEKKVQPLGIPKAQFVIDVSILETLNQYGCSGVEWRFSANPGKSPEPLSTSASGGELSRVMLGLYQLLSQQSEAAVLFFDEIDTGISGSVLQKMAEQLQTLGQKQQVLTITHHGIMASQADQHWHIRKTQTKDTTQSHVEILDCEGRAKVIAELMSGAKEQGHAEGLAKKMIG